MQTPACNVRIAASGVAIFDSMRSGHQLRPMGTNRIFFDGLCVLHLISRNHGSNCFRIHLVAVKSIP